MQTIHSAGTGAMEKTFHIAQRLLSTYDEMPRGERRLADLLLEDVGVLGYLTASDLADQAGVSKATAARLFRRLGYHGYRDAQREVRENKSTKAAAPEVPALSGGFLSPGEYLDAEVKHLVRTFETLPAEQMSEAVEILCRAAKLWVVGFGEGYPLALFARALLIKVFPDIRMIPLSGFPVPEEFASINPEDAVLAFGVGRRIVAPGGREGNPRDQFHRRRGQARRRPDPARAIRGAHGLRFDDRAAQPRHLPLCARGDPDRRFGTAASGPHRVDSFSMG